MKKSDDSRRAHIEKMKRRAGVHINSCCDLRASSLRALANSLPWLTEGRGPPAAAIAASGSTRCAQLPSVRSLTSRRAYFRFPQTLRQARAPATRLTKRMNTSVLLLLSICRECAHRMSMHVMEMKRRYYASLCKFYCYRYELAPRSPSLLPFMCFNAF